MIIRLIDKINLEFVRGDITKQSDCDVIVNAANAQLRSGGGVAGAIHRIGDPELEMETRNFTPIKTGQAVLTSAPNFPNKAIIHCLGPVYGVDKPEETLLGDCYLNAINLADSKKFASIAFPAISTGAFGYPAEEAAEVAFEIIRNISENLTHLHLIRFVLWSDEDVEIHQKMAEKVFG